MDLNATFGTRSHDFCRVVSMLSLTNVLPPKKKLPDMLEGMMGVVTKRYMPSMLRHQQVTNKGLILSLKPGLHT